MPADYNAADLFPGRELIDLNPGKSIENTSTYALIGIRQESAVNNPGRCFSKPRSQEAVKLPCAPSRMAFLHPNQ
jgi:hypothetical protein